MHRRRGASCAPYPRPRAMGLQIQVLKASTRSEIEAAFVALVRDRGPVSWLPRRRRDEHRPRHRDRPAIGLLSHLRAHRPVAAVPGVTHLVPSVAPVAQTKLPPASLSTP